jgi:endonuclease YncB( thermonuclease family)
VTELGERARSVTLNWLREEPFHIHTRDESVMGSERHHAMIYFPKAPQENQRWLSQRLVAAGLARIYTKGTRLADGTSEAQFEAALKQLEAEAKAQEQGAWGL